MWRRIAFSLILLVGLGLRIGYLLSLQPYPSVVQARNAPRAAAAVAEASAPRSEAGVARIVLGWATLPVVAGLALTIAGGFAGNVAAAAAALYGPWVFHGATRSAVTSTVFLVASALVLLALATRRSKVREAGLLAAVGGWVVGLISAAQAFLLPFAVFAAGCIWLRSPSPRKPRIAALYAAGLVVGLGFGFLLRPQTSTWMVETQAAAGAGLSLNERLGVLLGDVEITGGPNYDLVRELNPILRLATLQFRTVAVLAVVGLVFALRRRMDVSFLLALSIGSCVAAFFVDVTPAHRQVFVLSLVAFAALAIDGAWRAIRDAGSPRGALVLAAAVLLAPFVIPAPAAEIAPGDYASASAAYVVEAREREAAGELSAARRRYVKALILDPTSAAAAAAIDRLVPRNPPGGTADIAAARREARALCEEAQRRIDRGELFEARGVLETARRKAPFDPEAYRRLARVSLREGREDLAVEWLEKALLLAPLDRAIRRELATLRGLTPDAPPGIGSKY